MGWKIGGTFREKPRQWLPTSYIHENQCNHTMISVRVGVGRWGGEDTEHHWLSLTVDCGP